MKKLLAAVLTAASVLTVAAPSHAAKQDRLSQARDRVRSQPDSELIALLREADSKRQSLEESIAHLGDRLNAIERKLSALRPALEEAQHERDRAAAALGVAESALRHGRETLGRNALSLYATGRWTDALTVLGVSDVADLASAQVYIDSVIQSNSSIIDQFEAARRRLVQAKKSVDARTQSIVEEQKSIEAEQARLLKLTESKQQAAVQLTSALVERTKALGAINGDANGFQLIMSSYGQASGSVKLLVAAAQEGQPIEKPHSGALWWPAEGHISSPYGWRIHPIFKQRSFHTGVDIAADYGAPIRASRAGTVVDVIYLGAYGLVTVIDHGYSIATLYAHQSRSLVHPGEQVQAGQVIGAIGCTGWCTGPHIHFEVWSRGTPTNPVRWI